jgi:hypothetical protein
MNKPGAIVQTRIPDGCTPPSGDSTPLRSTIGHPTSGDMTLETPHASSGSAM